jgi:hypothetical protein
MYIRHRILAPLYFLWSHRLINLQQRRRAECVVIAQQQSQTSYDNRDEAALLECLNLAF